jgi:hypothetical protein
LEISFNNGSRKDYFKNTTNYIILKKAKWLPWKVLVVLMWVCVNLTGELVKLQLKKNNIDEKSPDIKK